MVAHKCPHCFTEFPEYAELLEHFNIHIGMKRYKCRLCTKWFLYQRELPKHVSQDHNEKCRMTCVDCGKVLQNNRTFLQHYRIKHMTDRTYECCLCNKSFEISGKFVSHLQVHQKNHTCPVCGKPFSYKRLQSHLCTHTGQRPYACDRCDRSYVSSSHFSKHKKNCHKNGND